MNLERALLVGALARVERAVYQLPCVDATHVLLLRAQSLPKYGVSVPTRVVRKASHVVLGYQLPSPPRARPLLDKLAQRKARATHTERVAPGVDEFGDRLREAQGARALLLEIFRRAAYDWVLYRTSSRLDQKQLAEDAYTWIFVEDAGHPHRRMRRENHKSLTSFMSICENLDQDPEQLRRHVRNLTPNKVMSSGRPPENSRATESSQSVEVHAHLPDSRGSFDFDVLINHLLDLDF